MPEPDFQPARNTMERLFQVMEIATRIAMEASRLRESSREILPGSVSAELIAEMPGNLRGLLRRLECL